MDFTVLLYLLKGIVAGFLVSVPLGPIGIILVQRTVSKGVKSGFISGLGVATADTFYAIIAVFGLTFLTNFLMSQIVPFKIIGGIILLVLGIRIYNTSPSVKSHKKAKSTIKKGGFFRDFFSMFFLTITNPLTIVLYGSVFALLGLGFNGYNPKNAFILTIGISIGAILWWFMLSSGVNLFKHKINLKRLSLINKITGVVVIGLAIFAALSILFS